MSVYEYEGGKFKLPSQEYPKLRQALEVAVKDHKAKVFGHTQMFWKGLTPKQKSHPGEYQKAARNYADKTFTNFADDSLHDEFQDKTDRVIDRSAAKPRRVVQTDMDYPNNRTTQFRIGEVSVRFDKDTSTVGYYVDENNHSVERSHDNPLRQKLFTQLEQMRWARDTGGVVRGNDEYNDQGVYDVVAYGPIGESEAPAVVKDYVTTKGKRVSANEVFVRHLNAQAAARKAFDKSMRTSGQLRQKQLGVPTVNGGRYGATVRGESSHTSGLGNQYLG